MLKKKYELGRAYWVGATVVAQSEEEARRKFEKKFEIPNLEFSEGQTEVSEAVNSSEPPKNDDGDLICGRLVKKGRFSLEPCHNRVSEPFMPCHLHEEKD